MSKKQFLLSLLSLLLSLSWGHTALAGKEEAREKERQEKLKKQEEQLRVQRGKLMEQFKSH